MLGSSDIDQSAAAGFDCHSEGECRNQARRMLEIANTIITIAYEKHAIESIDRYRTPGVTPDDTDLDRWRSQSGIMQR